MSNGIQAPRQRPSIRTRGFGVAGVLPLHQPAHGERAPSRTGCGVCWMGPILQPRMSGRPSQGSTLGERDTHCQTLNSPGMGASARSVQTSETGMGESGNWPAPFDTRTGAVHSRGLVGRSLPEWACLNAIVGDTLLLLYDGWLIVRSIQNCNCTKDCPH